MFGERLGDQDVLFPMPCDLVAEGAPAAFPTVGKADAQVFGQVGVAGALETRGWRRRKRGCAEGTIKTVGCPLAAYRAEKRQLAFIHLGLPFERKISTGGAVAHGGRFERSAITFGQSLFFRQPFGNGDLYIGIPALRIEVRYLREGKPEFAFPAPDQYGAVGGL